MSLYAPLASYLKHLRKLRELIPGEVYIVRFKNSLRNYKTDIWVGVIAPENFGPESHRQRRPVSARPDEGPWITHLKDRFYSVYLPGRNLFRWIGLNDLFLLEEKTPNLFSALSRQTEAEVFEDLRKIVLKDPGLTFWKDMSNQEIGIKGKRGRTVALVLPEGYDAMIAELKLSHASLATSSSDEASTAGSESRDESQDVKEAKPEKKDAATQLPPAKVQARGGSFSENRRWKPAEFQSASASKGKGVLKDISRSPQNQNDKPSFLGAVAEGKIPGPFNLTANQLLLDKEGFPRPIFEQTKKSNPAGSSATDARTSALGDGVPLKKEKDESSSTDLKATDKATPENTSVFGLTLQTALEHVYLQKYDSAEILAIFHEIVDNQNKPEAAQIRSFLTTREFAPRLIQVNSPPLLTGPAKEANSSTTTYRVGDLCGTGHKYQLEGVSNSDNLCSQILSLGRLYTQARRFGLTALIGLIILKLQAAWNSYPGLHQLEPLLEVTSLVFSGEGGPDGDDMQYWLVSFIADAKDLFLFECPARFWEVMCGNQTLMNAVFQLRNDTQRKDPDKYADSRVLIRSRGVDQF